jgi:hypothetical protein
MTFAFATLAFLAAAWLSVVVLAGTLEEYGAKVLAALTGTAPAPIAAMSIQTRQRYPARRPVRLRARPEWRAAA